MPVEIELKLQLDPRHIARLRDHPLLKHAAHSTTRKLYSVYYDTPDLDLWRAGIALRLRRAGAPASSKQSFRLRDATVSASGARWIQTIKSGGAAVAGLHQRKECEAEVATQFPDFSAIADAELAARFASIELRARLKPVIVTEFTRSCCMLAPAAGVAIEASIDHGIIKSGDATELVCELELEVKAGSAWRAYQVALQLLEAVPLLVEDRSKAERGMALHERVPRKPRQTPPSPVAAGMTSNDAFTALVQSCLAHYTANQRGTLDGADPEYLHQMRVALRRLRSVFSTFAPLFSATALAPPAAETRWLAQVLGPARDWDVFNADILPPVTARYARHAGMVAVTRSAARLRLAANRRARRAVASARGQGLLLALGSWLSAATWLEQLSEAQRGELQRPAAEFARTVLDAALKRVSKRGRHFASLAPRELHRLRIAAKKLRYAAEFFAPLYDADQTRDYRAALARLQDTLGVYNDAVTVTRLAERASRGLKGAAANEARGIMLGWSAGMQDAGTRHLKRIWNDFRAAKPFWK
jgi:inorganic triphosphatase YgiF